MHKFNQVDNNGILTLASFLPQINSRIILPNRGGYTITMRENSGTKEIINALSEQTLESNFPQLHVGWGSYRNLDIITTRKSKYAIICDVNMRQLDIWSKTFMAIMLSNNAEEFIEFMYRSLPKAPRPRYFGSSLKEWFYQNKKSKESWMNSHEKFVYVKDMVESNRIELMSCDIRENKNLDGKSIFSELNQSLQKMKDVGFCIPDTLYLTNLPWMMKRETGFFGEKHSDKNSVAPSAGFELMLNNLKILAPQFKHVISSHKLARNSIDNDLQWHTQLYTAENILNELDSDHDTV
jgi:hypothetical protein